MLSANKKHLHNNVKEALNLLKDITLSYRDIQDECKNLTDKQLKGKIQGFENKVEEGKISSANRYCYYLFFIERLMSKKLESYHYNKLIRGINQYSEIIYSQLNEKNPNYHGMCQVLAKVSPKIRAIFNSKEFSFIQDKISSLDKLSQYKTEEFLGDQISLLQQDYDDLIASENTKSYSYGYTLRLDEKIFDIQEEAKSLSPASQEIYNSFAKQLSELRSEIFRKIFFGPLIENGSNEFSSSLRQALTELDPTENEAQNKTSPKWWQFWKKSEENSFKQQQRVTKQNIMGIIQNQEMNFGTKLNKIDNLNKDGNIKDFSALRAKAYLVVSLDAFYKGEIDIVGLKLMLKKMAKIDNKTSKLFAKIETSMTESYLKYASQYVVDYKSMEDKIKHRPNPIRFIKLMEETIAEKERNRDNIENETQKLSSWNIFQRYKLNAKKAENNNLLLESNQHLNSLKSGNPYAIATTMKKILDNDEVFRLSTKYKYPSVACSP